MKKMLVIIATISAWIVMPTVAQEYQTVSVDLISIPSGAETRIDGEMVGIAPLTLDIVPGVHHVSFALQGFREWSDNMMFVVPQQKVWADLQGGNSLIRIPYPPTKVYWSSHRNQLRFQPFLGEGIESPYLTWDLDSESITHNSLPLDLLEDNELRLQLDIQGDSEKSITAYQSPSNRYIVFPQLTGKIDSYDGKAWKLKIFDRETEAIYDTYLVVYDTVLASTAPPFQVYWSTNEIVVGIELPSGGLTNGALFYFFLQDNPVDLIPLHSFIADTEEEVFVKDVISPPSNQGKVLVYNRDFLPDFPISNLWLVDITSLTGTRFPIEGVYDAVFSPADNEAIIIAHEGGISRVNLHDFTQIELITDDISAKWNVYSVDLSPTARYAVVKAGKNAISSYWLYELPEG